MKLRIKLRFLWSATLCAAIASPVVVAAIAPHGTDLSEQRNLVASLPTLDQDPEQEPERVWVRLRQQVMLEPLAASLNLSAARLANLNGVDTFHQFSAGDWLVLPNTRLRAGRLPRQIDASEMRRTPPLQELPPVESNAVVRFGDTLRRIAGRYGMTLQELLRINPGIETARLVVGSPVRVMPAATARPSLLLGVRPASSGALSWPDLPDFGAENPGWRPDGSGEGWIWPTKGMFSSGYGWRWGRMHKGIDIANSIGTPIHAAKDGLISFAGWHSGGYGYLVTIMHSDGSRSLYAHNSQLLVRAGDPVRQGDQIAAMGSTGRSTGPHLHFEIHPPGRGAANPLQFLPQRA